MNILLPKYATNYDLAPIKSEEEANKFGLTFEKSRFKHKDYVIYWGSQPYNPDFADSYGVMETGFFNDGCFIDTVGNYHTSSLNSRQAYNEIAAFDLSGRKSARDLILSRPEHLQSKYNAAFGPVKEVEENIILALQNPGDRSIYSVSNRRSYMEFVDECCRFYGKSLFVKMHPWNSNEKYDELADIAKKHGCNFGKAPVSVIEGKEFVISYNSTFAVDCCLRGVPVVQYQMGTFYNCFGIHYSNQSFPVKINPIPDAHKLCDFLIYKYCYNKQMDKDLFVHMVRDFSTSTKMFPMTDPYCYATNMH
tara:strand:- start:727 stop:1647 length:921 start_codon:yes stop_codon:yes gene_type:complete